MLFRSHAAQQAEKKLVPRDKSTQSGDWIGLGGDLKADRVQPQYCSYKYKLELIKQFFVGRQNLIPLITDFIIFYANYSMLYVRGFLRKLTTPPQYPTRSFKRLHSCSCCVFQACRADNKASLPMTMSKCSRKNTVIQAWLSS